MNNGLPVKFIAVLLGLFLIWMLASVQCTEAETAASAEGMIINKATTEGAAAFSNRTDIVYDTRR
jgi:hypothetical protein